MKKETLAKISALTLAAMLLTSCNNNPAVTTDKPVTTEPTPSTSQSEVVKHVDFDYKDPFEDLVDNRKIYLYENYDPYYYFETRKKDKPYQIVYHKFNKEYYNDGDLYYLLACGKDNNPDDAYEHAYMKESSRDAKFARITRNKEFEKDDEYYFCDECFGTEESREEFKKEASRCGARNIQLYYLSAEVDFHMESELEK